MRPVDKGAAPRTYRKWSAARPDLIERLGRNCSFCEMPLTHLVHVAHVIPRANGGHHTDWANLLLGCVHCNSTQGSRNQSRQQHAWPDEDNTFRAIAYSEDNGAVLLDARNNLTAGETQLALDTIELFGLNRHPGHPNFSPKDPRWHLRNTAWQRAQLALARWHRNPSQDMEDAIIDQATDSGFFSIWMEVFQNETQIRQRLIDRFPNTAPSCFDPQTQPLKHPTGKV